MKTEIKEQKLFKIVNKFGHHGFFYKEGWNIDPLPFNPRGNCEDGGIYFAGSDILAFLGYGESVYEVTNYSTPYENPGTPKKYKAHEVELKYIGEWKNVEVVKYLIENGADIHADGDYVLSCSAYNGHLEVVKYLIENGVDIHAWYEDALRWSAKNGHLEVVKYLIENGADIHAGDEDALRYSARNGHFEVVKYLIENGANIHADNDFALRWSAGNGRLEVVKYLIEHGADVQAAIKHSKMLENFKIVRTLEKFL